MRMPSASQTLRVPADTGTAATLVDAWYAEALRPFGASAVDAALAERFPAIWVRLARRVPAVRGVLWFLASRNAHRIVSPFSAPGLPMLLLLHRCLSPRPPQLLLLEFLRGEPEGRLARLKESLHVAMFSALLPHMLARAQVMTPWEVQAYATKYRLPRECFTFIAFPMVRQPTPALADWHGTPRQVLASGRAACDWATLMNAARGATWPLTIVCAASDRPAVDALNRDGRARVLSEISHEAHQQLLDQAAVYALVLREQRASSGQVRLAHAAMRERSLDAYVDRIRAFVFDDSAGSRPSPGAGATPLRVAYCGPIGRPGQPAGGGYESANRRNCDALLRRGLQVTELPYPKATARPLQRLLRYGASFARAAWTLLARRADYDLLHLTPLNMHFAFAETLLVSCARLAGRPVLLDVRAGTFLRHYDAGSAFYRHTIDRTLRRASGVSVEGLAYIPFVRQRSGAPVLHFPNYVDGPALAIEPNTSAPSADGPVRLIYFGRLVAEKGIDTAIGALQTLIERGVRAELELIGDGPRDSLAALHERAAQLPVRWTEGLPIDQIMKRAAQAHFFFFASRHDGEGHSNALNEAMSVGLVPVCSEQGFTRSVVGDAGVVLPVEADANAYADAIVEILVTGRWAKLSQAARTRVRTQFSEAATVPALIAAYQQALRQRA